MRMLRRMAALCLCMLLMLTAALAQTSFLPGTEDWTLDTLPLQVDVAVKVKTHMPFDENRLTSLTAILDRLTMRLNWQPLAGETQSRVSLLMNGTELLVMNQQQNQQETLMQLSSVPDTTFAASSAPLDILLEDDTQTVLPFGIDITAYAWLEEGYQLLNSLLPALDPYVKEKSVKTSIEDMGTARVCQDYTVSKDDAPMLTETLSALCPEGRLKTLISGLVFSGKQTLRVYRTAEGVPLRMEYNGNCGVDEDHLRDVQLIWRLRRDDTAWRDEVTLKSPALKGSDKNTVTWTCHITKPKSTTRRLKGELQIVTVKDKAKTTLEGELNLLNTMKNDVHHITGDVMVRQMLPEEDTWEKFVLEPDMTVEGTVDAPLMAGELTLAYYQGSKAVEQATLTLQLQHTDYLGWSMRDNTVDLSLLSEDELTAARQQVQQAVASELVIGLLRQMGTEATYLLQDLPEETVQLLLNAVGQ